MLVVTLLVLAMTASDPAPAPVAAEPAPKSKAERDKEKVCYEVTPTGSVVSKRVCKTRKQWRQLQDAQRRAGETMLDAGSSNQTRRE